MSNINKNVSKAIDELVKSMMNKVMNRVLVEDPFIPEVHHNNKPVYAALVPDVIFRDSHFERRFVTPFGIFWEKMAHLLGTAYHGHCEKGKNVEGTVGRESLRRIQEVLNRLEHPNKKKERKNQIGRTNWPIFGMVAESRWPSMSHVTFLLKANLPARLIPSN